MAVRGVDYLSGLDDSARSFDAIAGGLIGLDGLDWCQGFDVQPTLILLQKLREDAYYQPVRPSSAGGCDVSAHSIVYAVILFWYQRAFSTVQSQKTYRSQLLSGHKSAMTLEIRIVMLESTDLCLELFKDFVAGKQL